MPICSNGSELFGPSSAASPCPLLWLLSWASLLMSTTVSSYHRKQPLVIAGAQQHFDVGSGPD